MARRKSAQRRTDGAPGLPDLGDVGERLRAARAKIGMTRRQLAAASGTSERYLANIETGRGNPSVSVLTALAAAVDLAVAELLPQGGERDPATAELAAALRRVPVGRRAALQEVMQAHPTAAARARRLVLIGLRGAGKTSLGTALARRLAVPFIEMSREVERAYGGEIGILIESRGQGALRRYEEEAWETIVAQHPAAVVAASGGVVADPILYDRLLATAHSIWLEARPEDHMERVMAQGDFRPMASNRGAMADLKAILEARRADYARADARLDTSAQGFAATLAVLERLAARLLHESAL